MSDTPETDAKRKAIQSPPYSLDVDRFADFARSLERERDKYRRDCEIAIEGFKAIREALGDPAGIPMQQDLVEYIRDLNNRHKRAEPILARLADGYLVSVLDDATPGEELGQRVLEYWREIEEREAGES